MIARRRLNAQERACLNSSVLFAGIDAATVDTWAAEATVVVVEEDATVFEEGDVATNFYVVLEGQISIVKRGAIRGVFEPVAFVGPGDCLGELPLVAGNKRSAAAIASLPSTLATFSVARFRAAFAASGSFDPYFRLRQNIQGTLLERLSSMNARVAALLDERQKIGIFLIYLLSVLCLFMFATHAVMRMTNKQAGTTMITLPMLVLIVLSLVPVLQKLRLPIRVLGFKTVAWRKSLAEGIFLAAGLVALTSAVKWRWIAGNPTVPFLDVFYSLSRKYGDPIRARMHFYSMNVIYIAVIAPLQEWISRSLLQELLERFIASKSRVAISIVLSNLIFATFHLYVSLPAAIFTWFLGLALGSLYARHRHLLGPIVAHAIVGFWSLSIVRLHELF